MHAIGFSTRGTLVFACVMTIAGCREANQFKAPPPPKVTVAKPLVQTVVTYDSIPGRTEATESVEVRARVEGFLKSVDFDEGSEIKAGDLLYTIEPERYEADVKGAEARLADAKAVLDKAAFHKTRMEGLHADNVAAEVELVEAGTDFRQAEAEVLAAEAALASAKLDLTYTRITAPISGYINRTEVNVGNLVGRGEQTLLTSIVPWDPMHVYVNIGERRVLIWRRRLSVGEERGEVPLSLRMADGEAYPVPGRVDYIDNQVDVNTGTLRARAIFDNPQRLLVPGIFVRVRMPSEPIQAVMIPQSALQRDLTGYFVFVVSSAGEVSRVDVQTGPQVVDYYTVTSGLTGDELVIIKGLQRVQAGGTVDATTVTLTPVEQPGVFDAPATPAAPGTPAANGSDAASE